MYVNVVLHVNDEGRIDLLAVIWPDGRTFRIDEVLYRGEPGQMQKGGRKRRASASVSGGRKPICTWSAAKVRRRSAPPTPTAGGSTPSTTPRLSLAVRGTGGCACGRVTGSPRRTAQEVKRDTFSSRATGIL